MRNLHRAGLLIAIASLAFAPSCGGGAPAGGPRVAVTAPEAPPARTVETGVNSKGLREGRELAYSKPKGRMRILCVGGAATFGEGVPRDLAFPAWMQRNMRGRAYDVEVLNAGKPGLGAAESAAQLEVELLKYQPDLVVVSIQGGEGTTTRADLQRIEAMLGEKTIVYILLAVPDLPEVERYAPRPPAVYVVPSKAALDVFADKHPLLDTDGHWTEFAHKTMGNALAELIVGAPLLCCATGPIPANP